MRAVDIAILGGLGILGYAVYTGLGSGTGKGKGKTGRPGMPFVFVSGPSVPALGSMTGPGAVRVGKYAETTTKAVTEAVTKAKRTAESVAKTVTEAPSRIVKPVADTVSKIANIPKTVSDTAKSVSGLGETVKFVAGSYVAGKGLQVLSKAIPERKVIQTVERKVATETLKRAGARAGLNLLKAAGKIATKGAGILTAISLGATAGKLIGEATAQSDIAKGFREYYQQHKDEPLMKAFSVIGSAVSNIFSLV